MITSTSDELNELTKTLLRGDDDETDDALSPVSEDSALRASSPNPSLNNSVEVSNRPVNTMRKSQNLTISVEKY